MDTRILLAVLLVIPACSALQITEIMQNPAGSDADREWIEIYNNESEPCNVSDWKLVTDNVIHTLNTDATSEFIFPGSYAVIVQNIPSFLADYSDFNGTAIDSSWSGLSNSAGESVIIKTASVILDNVTYSLAAEGNSSCLVNGIFVDCIPTPGAANLKEYTEPPENTANTTCNVTLSIDAPEIYESVYTILVNSTNCTDQDVDIEYWIEDMFGNIVKDKTNTTQTVGCFKSVSRQWTPPAPEGSEAYRIFAASCNSTASKVVVVRGSQPGSLSSITITDSGDGTKFGGAVYVDMIVYRGDTGKYSVDVYVRRSDGTKVSGISKFHAGTKFKSYEVSIPVQLKPNCDGNYGDGAYAVVAEGLDVVAARSIQISGVSAENCKKEIVTVSSGGGSGGSSVVPTTKSSIDILAYPETVYAGGAFNVTMRLNSSRNYTIYSYVFRGTTPVSEGFDGTKWTASWTANRQNTAGPATVVLKNRIEDDTLPGIYTLRIRAKSDREEEISRDIEVRETVRSVVIPDSVENTTVNFSDEAAGTALPKLTGMVVQKNRQFDSRLSILNIFSMLRTRLFKK